MLFDNYSDDCHSGSIPNQIVFLMLISRAYLTRAGGQSGLHPGQNVAQPSFGLLFIVHPVEGQSGLHPSQNVSSSIISLTRVVISHLKVNSPLNIVGILCGVTHTLSPGLSWVGSRFSYVTSRSPPSPVACMDWVWFGFDGTAVLHACTIVTMISIFV